MPVMMITIRASSLAAVNTSWILVDQRTFLTLTNVKIAGTNNKIDLTLDPLTAGVAYIQVFIFYHHIKYHLLSMLKVKCDINQKYLKRVDLHFVKSE